MGSSIGGGGGDQEITVRYPEYVEEHHSTFLDLVAEYRDLLIDDSPYVDYDGIDYSDGFFGSGYVMANFPSLYDMYGKFMAGLDIEVLFTQILDDSINNTAIDNRVSAHAAYLDDDLEYNAWPRVATGMRDINSVIASTFVIAKDELEKNRQKVLSAYDAELRVRMLPVAVQRYGIHLNWNNSVITTYTQMMQLYFATALDINNHEFDIWAKDKIWPFTILEYNRAAIGALTGAQTTKGPDGPSPLARGLGGALSMGAAGWQAGGPLGAGVGAALGLAAAFL